MTADVVANDEQYILQTYSRPGFVIARGEGCYLYDTEGNRYLDLVAGIAVNALLPGASVPALTVMGAVDVLVPRLP